MEKLTRLRASDFHDRFSDVLTFPLAEDRFIMIRYTKKTKYFVQVFKLIDKKIVKPYFTARFETWKSATEYFDEKIEYMTNLFKVNGCAPFTRKTA